MRLGIIGAGRAAWAFGATWRRIGWPITGIATRGDREITRLLDARPSSIEDLAASSELILIAVNDAAIAEVAGEIPETKAIVWHASGSLTSVRGGFSLHPLRALPDVGEEADLRDTLLVFEGAHREVAQRIASAAEARFAEIAAADKPRYHAAAVFASNYVAALLDIASGLAGIENVRGDLAALAQSAIDNWLHHTDARRFTGPAARGDRGVIDGHMEVLQAQEDLQLIYRLLADRILATRK
jgi:predicted short-subunit dehydrogenase-like oxidoreductase (DUF2520 family)